MRQFGLIAFWSLLFVVIGLLPSRSPHVVTDGTRLRMLRNGGEEAERFCCLLVLTAAVLGGVRPREWSASLLHVATSGDDASPDALVGLSLRYNWLLDAGGIHEAGEVLDAIVKRDLPDAALAVWKLESAWYSARFRQNPEQARAHREAASPAPKSEAISAGRAKAEGGIACAEQRWDDAEAAAQKALKVYERMGASGTDLALREELETLLADVAAGNEQQRTAKARTDAARCLYLHWMAARIQASGLTPRYFF